MDFGPQIISPTPSATSPPTLAATSSEESAKEVDAFSLLMLALTFAAMILTGSTLEWVISRGVLFKGLGTRNLYNIIVLVAGTSSCFQSIFSFLLYFYEPSNVAFISASIVNWMVMTHSSVMVVSNRLSMLYRNPKQVWRRLLLINVFMMPISILVFVSWGGDKFSGLEIYQTLNRVTEPTQVGLWGIIEFVLSGTFAVKLWAFKWEAMERRTFAVLVLVALCDLATVFTNIFVGDLPTTVVKGFVYCLRIRLEINVLVVLVEYLRNKSRVTGVSDNFGKTNPSGLASSLKGGRNSGDSQQVRSVRFSEEDDDLPLGSSAEPVEANPSNDATHEDIESGTQDSSKESSSD